MSSKYGINVELYNGSLNGYDIDNKRPIAIVAMIVSLRLGCMYLAQ